MDYENGPNIPVEVARRLMHNAPCSSFVPGSGECSMSAETSTHRPSSLNASRRLEKETKRTAFSGSNVSKRPSSSIFTQTDKAAFNYKTSKSTTGMPKRLTSQQLRSHTLPKNVWPGSLQSSDDLRRVWGPFSPLPVLLSECLSELAWQEKYFLLKEVFNEAVSHEKLFSIRGSEPRMNFKQFSTVMQMFPCVEQAYVRDLFSFLDCQRNASIEEAEFISGLLVASPEARHLGSRGLDSTRYRSCTQKPSTIIERTSGICPCALIRLQLIFLTFDADRDAVLNVEEVTRLLSRVLSLLSNEKRSGRSGLTDYSRDAMDSVLGNVFWKVASRSLRPAGSHLKRAANESANGNVLQQRVKQPGHKIQSDDSELDGTNFGDLLAPATKKLGEFMATSLKKIFGGTKETSVNNSSKLEQTHRMNNFKEKGFRESQENRETASAFSEDNATAVNQPAARLRGSRNNPSAKLEQRPVQPFPKNLSTTGLTPSARQRHCAPPSSANMMSLQDNVSYARETLGYQELNSGVQRSSTQTSLSNGQKDSTLENHPPRMIHHASNVTSLPVIDDSDSCSSPPVVAHKTCRQTSHAGRTTQQLNSFVNNGTSFSGTLITPETRQPFLRLDKSEQEVPREFFEINDSVLDMALTTDVLSTCHGGDELAPFGNVSENFNTWGEQDQLYDAQKRCSATMSNKFETMPRSAPMSRREPLEHSDMYLNIVTAGIRRADSRIESSAGYTTRTRQFNATPVHGASIPALVFDDFRCYSTFDDPFCSLQVTKRKGALRQSQFEVLSVFSSGSDKNTVFTKMGSPSESYAADAFASSPKVSSRVSRGPSLGLSPTHQDVQEDVQRKSPFRRLESSDMDMCGHDNILSGLPSWQPTAQSVPGSQGGSTHGKVSLPSENLTECGQGFDDLCFRDTCSTKVQSRKAISVHQEPLHGATPSLSLGVLNNLKPQAKGSALIPSDATGYSGSSPQTLKNTGVFGSKNKQSVRSSTCPRRPVLGAIDAEQLYAWSQNNVREIAAALIAHYDVFGDNRGLSFSAFIEVVKTNDLPGTNMLLRTRRDMCDVILERRKERAKSMKLTTPMSSFNDGHSECVVKHEAPICALSEETERLGKNIACRAPSPPCSLSVIATPQELLCRSYPDEFLPNFASSYPSGAGAEDSSVLEPVVEKQASAYPTKFKNAILVDNSRTESGISKTRSNTQISNKELTQEGSRCGYVLFSQSPSRKTEPISIPATPQSTVSTKQSTRRLRKQSRCQVLPTAAESFDDAFSGECTPPDVNVACTRLAPGSKCVTASSLDAEFRIPKTPMGQDGIKSELGLAATKTKDAELFNKINTSDKESSSKYSGKDVQVVSNLTSCFSPSRVDDVQQQLCRQASCGMQSVVSMEFSGVVPHKNQKKLSKESSAFFDCVDESKKKNLPYVNDVVELDTISAKDYNGGAIAGSSDFESLLQLPLDYSAVSTPALPEIYTRHLVYPVQLLQQLAETHERNMRLARRVIAAVSTLKFDGWKGPKLLPNTTEKRWHPAAPLKPVWQSPPLRVPGLEESPLYLLQTKRADSCQKLLPFDILLQLCNAVVEIVRQEPKIITVAAPLTVVANSLVKKTANASRILESCCENYTPTEQQCCVSSDDEEGSNPLYKLNPLLVPFTEGCESSGGTYLSKPSSAKGTRNDAKKKVVLLGNIAFGTRRGECVELVALLFAIKLLYPTTFTLLRGPFEDFFVSVAFGFGQECCERYGFTEGRELHRRFFDVMEFLPLCASIECFSEGGVEHRALCLPGDLPSKTHVSVFQQLNAVAADNLATPELPIPSLLLHFVQPPQKEQTRSWRACNVQGNVACCTSTAATSRLPVSESSGCGEDRQTQFSFEEIEDAFIKNFLDAASPHAVSNGDQGVGMASTCVVPLVRTAASDAVDSSKRTLPFDKSNFDLRKMNLFFELVWSKELMLAFNTRTAYYDGIRFTNVKPGVADSTPRQERRGRHRTLFSNVVLKDTRFSPATRHWVLQALGYTHLLRLVPSSTSWKDRLENEIPQNVLCPVKYDVCVERLLQPQMSGGAVAQPFDVQKAPNISIHAQQRSCASLANKKGPTTDIFLH